MKPISKLLIDIKDRLQALSDTAWLDTQVLLAHILGVQRAWVLAHPEARLTAGQEQALEQALERLEAGEPLPYVLGHWEFYGLDFAVSPAVLIPRPETELLVEQALAWLRALLPLKRIRAADIGAGSGNIAVTLAVNAPRQTPSSLQVVAVDISFEALQVARRNVHAHGVAECVHLVQADLLAPFPNSSASPPFDLICANLPYIPEFTLKSLRVSQTEPLLALLGGSDGLAAIRRFLEAVPPLLAPGGLLLMEIEASQGAAALDLARAAFPSAHLRLLPDLASLDRLLRVDLSNGIAGSPIAGNPNA